MRIIKRLAARLEGVVAPWRRQRWGLNEVAQWIKCCDNISIARHHSFRLCMYTNETVVLCRPIWSHPGGWHTHTHTAGFSNWHPASSTITNGYPFRYYKRQRTLRRPHGNEFRLCVTVCMFYHLLNLKPVQGCIERLHEACIRIHSRIIQSRSAVTNS